MFDSVNARLAAFMALFKVQIRVALGIERRKAGETERKRERQRETARSACRREKHKDEPRRSGDSNHGTHKSKQ